MCIADNSLYACFYFQILTVKFMSIERIETELRGVLNRFLFETLGLFYSFRYWYF